MISQKGNIALVPLFLFLAALIFMALMLIKQGYVTPPVTPLTKNLTQSTSLSIKLKSEYENPFDKNSQYINPFSEYKNPFNLVK